VRLESPGPVLFRQRRHGRDGREIVVWKFRTMTACESDAEFRQVRRGDPRVSRLGAILRATSLDELPQLFNVLQGTMSLVGPRPHPIPLNEQHRDTMDWYMLRHRVKPGMTGWAQVNGFRGQTDILHKMQGRVDRDLEYIHNWSLSLDLRILALTVVRGFVGKNAY
jgi:putative colanic acid biosynthesis UDP-glucose lipid carrier transferase